MNAPRPMGPVRPSGRGSNGIVIREGQVNHCRIALVEGKGKSVLIENLDGKEILGGKINPGVAIHESSASDDLILRVNNFQGFLIRLRGVILVMICHRREF
ncbi:hypothetical protein MA16_Dca006241 [Dendrobium catenatum]|uniref:Uncharacterized protein n=1 Tax=Dendrobium catenatum TaxID=906689 RepID=A0A2I0W9C6_9ASPA|nr:hypothetical protein MA16_Dca006241 [Dendrobium catenatum]